jgi:hypothetical protein
MAIRIGLARVAGAIRHNPCLKEDRTFSTSIKMLLERTDERIRKEIATRQKHTHKKS